MTLSSGYLYFDCVLCAFVIREKTTVNTPTRPMYISAIMINFPIAVKSGVNPIVRPTVPNAEKTSKAIYSMPEVLGIVSVTDKIMMATTHNVNVTKNKVSARNTAPCRMVRPNASALVRPFKHRTHLDQQHT